MVCDEAVQRIPITAMKQMQHRKLERHGLAPSTPRLHGRVFGLGDYWASSKLMTASLASVDDHPPGTYASGPSLMRFSLVKLQEGGCGVAGTYRDFARVRSLGDAEQQADHQIAPE